VKIAEFISIGVVSSICSSLPLFLNGFTINLGLFLKVAYRGVSLQTFFAVTGWWGSQNNPALGTWGIRGIWYPHWLGIVREKILQWVWGSKNVCRLAHLYGIFWNSP